MLSTSLRSDVHQGKTVLVTGGGTGIGRATALAFAAGGARIAICGRRPEPLKETAEEIRAAGGECLELTADVREPEEIARVVDQVLAAYGRIDVLVNNAGGQFAAPAEQISAKGWRAVHRLAVDAAWETTRLTAVKSMIPNRSGVVFFIGFSPRRGIPGMVHATAARAAVENLAAGLSLEWSRYGIRSICVAPGTIATGGLDSNYTEEDRKRWASAVPLGRLGRPEEISEVISFLASPSGAYVTGTTVVVDGGVDAWGSGHPVPELVEAESPEAASSEAASSETASPAPVSARVDSVEAAP